MRGTIQNIWTASCRGQSTWNLDLPVNKVSSTWKDRPCPGHMVLSSVNQPPLAIFNPCSAVPGFCSSELIIAAVLLSVSAGDYKLINGQATAWPVDRSGGFEQSLAPRLRNLSTVPSTAKVAAPPSF